MKTVQQLILSFAVVLSLSTVASAQLPPEVQADFLQEKIVASLQAKDYGSAQTYILEYKNLNVSIPPAILLIDAKLSVSEGDWASAKSKLEVYFNAAGKTHGSYKEAFELYKTVDTKFEKQVADRKAKAEMEAQALSRRLIQARESAISQRKSSLNSKGVSSDTLTWYLQNKPAEVIRPILLSAAQPSDYKRWGEAGDTISNYLYYFSEGSEAFSEEEKYNLIKPSCDEKIMRACASLGVLYQSGIGVRKNEYKARELMEEAADAGNVLGFVNLGKYYVSGIGGSTNLAEGISLSKKACNAGFSDVCESLAKIRKICRGDNLGPKDRAGCREIGY